MALRVRNRKAERGAGLSCSPFPNNSPARPALGMGPALRFYAVAELAAAYLKTPILAAQDYMLILSAVRARYTGEPFWGIRE